MTWETMIGVEIHARLQTRTKMFCGCPNSFGSEPNTNVCAICLGYPGALPVLNGQAVRLAVRAALSLGASISPVSIFSRKNYFYPDLPKGYQISQDDRPLATTGSLPVRSGGARAVTIRRIHLEEDAGRLLHQTPGTSITASYSLVDLNRSGTPLIEIVTEPELRSAEDTVEFLNLLRQTLMFSDACDGNMEEGSIRCDVNVSVRRKGDAPGTRVEVKNLNSFRYAGRAIESETVRQIAELEAGRSIRQETRLFDVPSGETRLMRVKEEAHDYRYFPEPDLPPLSVSAETIDELRAGLPEAPHRRAHRLATTYGMPPDDAEVLVTTRQLADYFEETASLSGQPRLATNWIRNDLLAFADPGNPSEKISAVRLSELLVLLASGTIGGKAAKEIFERMLQDERHPGVIAEESGLTQISDPQVIRDAAIAVIERSPQQVAAFKGGRAALFGYFVGQVMKETGGRADAEAANSILRGLLED